MVEIERHLMVQSRSLHSCAMSSIDRRVIAGLLSEIKASSGPVAANRLRESLSAFFAWAIREGLLETNPAANTNREPEKTRDRALTREELREIWQALGEDRYADIVRLLVLTGARRDEIGGLRWEEVDLERAVITLPPARVKIGRERKTPLSAPALAILEVRMREGAEFVFGFRAWACPFSLWSRSKVELDQRIAAARKAAGKSPMPHWTLHDLRRTVSTGMHVELGILPHIVEAVLGHVGHQGGIAGTYNRAAYDGPKAEALAQWGEYLLAIVEDRPAKIVPMRGR